ncbi:MAG: hypothetical protein SA378_11610 [Sedimentibacter sp.]|uniref:glycine-rich domain-containing protein n=1 Tax=Sedimentibacter sp. TaxID=1960295 RepID=UPI00298112DC|nr:hypothetical protein [Sedimentibacter sp.]MDW5300762.1 hypothetical protein [Sedimentibacter sp.]
MPWQTPKTDWDTNPTNPVSDDFNRIEGNIDFLNTDIETKKGLIVDALSSVGIAALIADTHVQIANKILSAKKTGVSITPGSVNQEIPKGIYDTGGGVVLGDPDLISANIKAGANIFGVAGNSNVVDTSAGDATATQILSGKKAYVDGALVTGTIPSKGAATITPGTANQTIAAGQYLSGIQTIAGDVDLVAGNIKSGANIFGVAGIFDRAFTYETLTNGTSWTVPSGVNRIWVWMCGGGAGGNKGGSSSNIGGAGGASGQPTFFTQAVTAGQVLPYSIGAGSAGRSTVDTTSGGKATAGGDTVFNGVTAKGGQVTTETNAGYGGKGGAGGGAGAYNSNGAAGGSGLTLSNGGTCSPYTGGAGSGIELLQTGGKCPFNNVTYCGAGGGSGMRTNASNGGAGGAGGGGAGGTGGGASSTAGANGTLYGAGGGGVNYTSGLAAGNGYQGVIFVGYCI